MYLLNRTVRTAPTGRGLLGPNNSQGFTLGYSLFLPPGGTQSAHRRFCHGRELCEAAKGRYSGQAEEAQAASEARGR